MSGKFIFPDPIRLERILAKKREWIWLERFRYILPDGRQGQADEGGKTDKASIPQIVWWWLSPDDIRIIRPAGMHDDLYEKQMIEGQWITRAEADKLLYEACRQEGMRWTMAKAVYSAVRIGGGSYFDDRAKAMGNIHYIKSDNG